MIVACNQVPEIRDKQRGFREDVGSGQGGDGCHPFRKTSNVKRQFQCFLIFRRFAIPEICFTPYHNMLVLWAKIMNSLLICKPSGKTSFFLLGKPHIFREDRVRGWDGGEKWRNQVIEIQMMLFLTSLFCILIEVHSEHITLFFFSYILHNQTGHSHLKFSNQ